jgi:hypothetical protein
VIKKSKATFAEAAFDFLSYKWEPNFLLLLLADLSSNPKGIKICK